MLNKIGLLWHWAGRKRHWQDGFRTFWEVIAEIGKQLPWICDWRLQSVSHLQKHLLLKCLWVAFRFRWGFRKTRWIRIGHRIRHRESFSWEKQTHFRWALPARPISRQRRKHWLPVFHYLSRSTLFKQSKPHNNRPSSLRKRDNRCNRGHRLIQKRQRCYKQ